MARGRKTGGRQKGTPNKATAAAREALAVFMDGNADRLQGWLVAIEAKHGPLAAFNAYVSLLEFHVPKKTRVDEFDAANPFVHVSWLDAAEPVLPGST